MILQIFVDMDSDSRLSRRVIRDTGRFSRSLDSVLIEYTRFVKPCFEDFVLPVTIVNLKLALLLLRLYLDKEASGYRYPQRPRKFRGC